LREKAEAGDGTLAPYSDAEIIPIGPRLTPKASDTDQDGATDLPSVQTAEPIVVEVVDPSDTEQAPAARYSERGRTGVTGERLIISLLAMIFLLAGLAAAALSGFANFQAFSQGVSDPIQARIWGWSGVIASVCSFGGFTFFWWHLSGRRWGEAVRAIVFALAGAGTSIAGTSLFMINNADGQAADWQNAEQVRALTEADIEDWRRQLAGIPVETRSIEGLKAYLAGVEAAGRTHQKPYRDAQNELGLAERRARLEQNIASARANLRNTAAAQSVAQPARRLPAWFFAIMLELFSSQATSIAFVSLLLLYGRRERDPAPMRADVSEALIV